MVVHPEPPAFVGSCRPPDPFFFASTAAVAACDDVELLNGRANRHLELADRGHKRSPSG